MNTALAFDNIILNEIDVFAKTVCLYGFVEASGVPAEYIGQIDYEAFLYLMARDRKIGSEILHQINQQKAVPHACPINLNLVERFGMCVEFKKI